MSNGPQRFPLTRHFLLTFFSCLAGFAIAATAFAQAAANNPTPAPPNRLSFASATVTPAGTPGIQSDATHVTFYARSLRELVMLAYNVKIYQISGPSWLADQRFDIVATTPVGASPGDTPAMLQTLLQDRFKLVAHREMKNRAILALKVAKGGPKLLPAIGSGPMSTTTNGHDGSTLTFAGTTMDGLAETLTYLLHGGYDNRLAVQNFTEVEDQWQVMVNQTGLAGEYQASVNSSLDNSTIEIRIAEDISGSFPTTTHDFLGPARAIDEGDPMVGASLQRMGLELKQSSAKLEVLVISHAEKNPSPN